MQSGIHCTSSAGQKLAFADYLIEAPSKRICVKDWDAQFRKFLLDAHRYKSRELASEAKSLISVRSAKSIVSATSPFMFEVPSMYSYENPISNLDDAHAFKEKFLFARNALIIYSLVSEPHLDYFLVPFKDIRAGILGKTCEEKKTIFLEAVSAYGNLLPSRMYEELESLLIGSLNEEKDKSVKICILDTLANLLSTKSMHAIINSAEGEGPEFENTAFRAVIAISFAKDITRLRQTLPRFLFGNFSTETKVNAASLMYSFNFSEFEHLILAYLRDVADTIKMLQQIAWANTGCISGANEFLAKYYDRTGFYADLAAHAEILPYAAGEVKTEKDC